MPDTNQPPTPPEPEETSPPPGGSTPPPPVEPPAAPPPAGYQSPNRTIMIVLAYLGILALIPLLVEKEDEEVQWHAKQGLVLLVAWIVLFVALTVVSFIPVIGWIIGCASILLPLAILAFHIYLMIQGINGNRTRVPFVTDFAEKWQ